MCGDGHIYKHGRKLCRHIHLKEKSVVETRCIWTDFMTIAEKEKYLKDNPDETSSGCSCDCKWCSRNDT